MFYGAAVWDPWLIVSQMVCIQCLSYLSLGLLQWALLGFAQLQQRPQLQLSLALFFDPSALSLSTATAFLLNSLLGAVLVFLLVERAKKCLDFSATMYIIHLLCCCVYAGSVPSSLAWWALNALCLASTALASEWLCLRRELRDIPMRSSSSSSAAAAAAAAPQPGPSSSYDLMRRGLLRFVNLKL